MSGASGGASSSSGTMRHRQSMRRDIVKQGYLKKLPNAAKVGSSLKRPERRWFVFGVVGAGTEAEPYLEYYENEDKLFSNNPLNMILLDTCRYVIRNDTNTRYTNVFTLVLKDRHLNLVASRRNEMLDWCGAIESRLKYLGILQSGDNDYIEVPWSRPRPPTQSEFIPPPSATLGRNPTSPLPPPPSIPRPPTPPSSSSVSASSSSASGLTSGSGLGSASQQPPQQSASADLLLLDEDYSDARSTLTLQPQHSANSGGGIYENQQIIAWQENPNLNLWTPPASSSSSSTTHPSFTSHTFAGTRSSSASVSVPSSPSIATATAARASNLYSQTPGTLRLKSLNRSPARQTSVPARVVSVGAQSLSLSSETFEGSELELEDSGLATYSVPNKKSTSQEGTINGRGTDSDFPGGGTGGLTSPLPDAVPGAVPDILRDSVPGVLNSGDNNTVPPVSSPSSPGSPTPPELPPHPTSPLLSPLPGKTPSPPSSSELLSFASEFASEFTQDSTPDSAPIVSFASRASSSPQHPSKSSTTPSSPLQSPSKSPSPPPLPSSTKSTTTNTAKSPTKPSPFNMASGGRNTGNLIELDRALDSDEDTYEPVWDQTAVTRNPEETYSVPRPRPRPVVTQNGGGSGGTPKSPQGEQPPILPPKTNQRSSALLNTLPGGQRSRSPGAARGGTGAGSGAGSPASRSPAPHSPSPHSPASHSPVSAAGMSSSSSPLPPPLMSGRSPHVMLPAYSPSYPHSPQVGAEAYPPGPPSHQDPSLLSPKMREALGFGASGGPQDSSSAVGGWNSPPPDTLGAPPPYLPRGALERGANKSLKLSQVEQLQKEMKNTGGVKVVLRRVDCYLTVAIVDCCNAVWIAGWNQQARPFLHNAFHIGDQLVSINGQVVESARVALKLIKHSGGDSERVTFILRRTPHARVLALKRDVEGEALGIRRHGGTAEISHVDPGGVAGRQGLPAKAPTLAGDNLCDWWITEVNMRPLNLFFKDNEIEPCLNAVGKDISIMVQPSDFIKELKKQLKAMKKVPYKDFLLR